MFSERHLRSWRRAWFQIEPASLQVRPGDSPEPEVLHGRALPEHASRCPRRLKQLAD